MVLLVVLRLKGELSHLDQQARVQLEVLESPRVLHFSEVLYQVVDAELLELGATVLVCVDEKRADVVIIHVVHQRVFAKVL